MSGVKKRPDLAQNRKYSYLALQKQAISRTHGADSKRLFSAFQHLPALSLALKSDDEYGELQTKHSPPHKEQ